MIYAVSAQLPCPIDWDQPSRTHKRKWIRTYGNVAAATLLRTRRMEFYASANRSTSTDRITFKDMQGQPPNSYWTEFRPDNPPHSLSDDSTNMLPTNLGGDIEHLHVLDLSRRVLTLARLRFLLALRAGICLGLLLGERSARET